MENKIKFENIPWYVKAKVTKYLFLNDPYSLYDNKAYETIVRAVNASDDTPENTLDAMFGEITPWRYIVNYALKTNCLMYLTTDEFQRPNYEKKVYETINKVNWRRFYLTVEMVYNDPYFRYYCNRHKNIFFPQVDGFQDETHLEYLIFLLFEKYVLTVEPTDSVDLSVPVDLLYPFNNADNLNSVIQDKVTLQNEPILLRWKKEHYKGYADKEINPLCLSDKFECFLPDDIERKQAFPYADRPIDWEDGVAIGLYEDALFRHECSEDEEADEDTTEEEAINMALEEMGLNDEMNRFYSNKVEENLCNYKYIFPLLYNRLNDDRKYWLFDRYSCPKVANDLSTPPIDKSLICFDFDYMSDDFNQYINRTLDVLYDEDDFNDPLVFEKRCREDYKLDDYLHLKAYRFIVEYIEEHVGYNIYKIENFK